DGEVAARRADGGVRAKRARYARDPSTTASRRSPSPSQVDGEDLQSSFRPVAVKMYTPAKAGAQNSIANFAFFHTGARLSSGVHERRLSLHGRRSIARVQGFGNEILCRRSPVFLALWNAGASFSPLWSRQAGRRAARGARTESAGERARGFYRDFFDFC